MSKMLRIWGRISSINVRKVVLCAQVLELGFERIDAGLHMAEPWPNLERWYAQWLAHPASRGVLDLPLS